MTPQAEDVWRKRCPILFQETDMKKLPCPSASKKAMAWKYGPRGLILHGPTGTGKTRTAWLLIRRLMAENIFVRSMTCTDFGNQLADRFRDREGPTWWLRQVATQACLFLDDLDKCVFTPRVELELLAIVEKRTSHKLPTIVTMNVVGSVIEKALPVGGKPLVRRLREPGLFENVHFGKGPER